MRLTDRLMMILEIEQLVELFVRGFGAEGEWGGVTFLLSNLLVFRVC